MERQVQHEGSSTPVPAGPGRGRRAFLWTAGLTGAGAAALAATGGPATATAAATAGSPFVAQASSSPFVTVMDYGAVGNGTTDDTAAFQDAANAAAGGILLIPQPPVQYLVSGNIEISGSTSVFGAGWNPQLPTVKLAPASGASCLFASKGWLSGATAADEPIVIRDLSIDVSGANNATVYGIVLMALRSELGRIYVLNAGMSGLVLADRNSSGSNVTNTAVENRIYDCTVTWSSPAITAGQYGIWVQDHGTGALTDGYMYNNVVNGSGDFSIRHERAAGWFITGNHVYANQGSGMYFGNVWCTFCHHNEVDHFANSPAASTTYYGFDFETILENQPGTDGRPSFIDHNIATCNESAGASSNAYHYYRLRNSGSAGYSVTQFDHNFAHTDIPGTGTSVAWDFQPNSGTLELMGGFNVADGPSAVPIIGGGTLHQAAPSRVMYKSSQPVALGLSSTFGAATNFGTEQASLGFIPTAIALAWSGTFSGGTCQAQIIATFSNGSTLTLGKPALGAVSAAATQALNAGQLLALYKDGVHLTQLAVSAYTSQASTSVTLTADIAGFNAN